MSSAAKKSISARRAASKRHDFMHTNKNAYLHFSSIDQAQHEESIPGTRQRSGRPKPGSARRASPSSPMRQVQMLPGHPSYQGGMQDIQHEEHEEEERQEDPNGKMVYRNGTAVEDYHVAQQKAEQQAVMDYEHAQHQQFMVDSQMQHYGFHAGFQGPEFAPYGHPGFSPYGRPGRAAVGVDVDGDGVADYVVSGADRDGDGIPDALQGGPRFNRNSYYAVPGSYGRPVPQRSATVAVDVDGDGVADYVVSGADRDGDGIPDALQQGRRYGVPHGVPGSVFNRPRPQRSATVAVDVDGDGVADYVVSGADRDGDGIPDALQPGTRYSAPIIPEAYKRHSAPRNLFA